MGVGMFLATEAMLYLNYLQLAIRRTQGIIMALDEKCLECQEATEEELPGPSR